MGRMTVRPVLWKYMTDHVGEYVHAGTMTSDLGLTKQQVQQGMLHLADKGLVRIVVRGSSWVYEGAQPVEKIDDTEFHYEGDPLPGESPKAVNGVEVETGQKVPYVQGSGDLMEIIKCLNNGDILLQDSNGTLYVATRLEVK